MKLALASLLLLSAASSHANIKASGYVKNFWQYSHSAIDGRAYNLNTSRARLSLDGNTSLVKTHVDYDHQVAAGSFYRTREYQLFGYSPPKPWLNMEQTISTGSNIGWGHGVYRGWLGLESEQWVLRVGRQRVAWGTGKIWNPTDVLNPYDPLTIEPGERRGVDAVYGRLGVGDLSQLELAWAPKSSWIDHALLARAHGNWNEWDASLLGGKVRGSTGSFLVGGDFAGNWLNGTVRGELAYFTPQYRTPYWKANLGYDYIFPSGSTLTIEYDHAGNGQLDAMRYDFAAVRAGRETGTARNYAGATAGHDLHPLLKAEAALIVNLDDGSTYAMPSLTWNALNNLYLMAAFRRFGGDRTTEFGRQRNAAVLSAQYWF